MYLVSVVEDGATRNVRAELVVPESWLRPMGKLATSSSVEFVCLAELLRASTLTGGLLIPLFQRRYCWSTRENFPIAAENTSNDAT